MQHCSQGSKCAQGTERKVPTIVLRLFDLVKVLENSEQKHHLSEKTNSRQLS